MNEIKKDYEEKTNWLKKSCEDFCGKYVSEGMFPNSSIAEISFHKLRYERVELDPADRYISRDWLQSHGYSRMVGFGDFLPHPHLPGRG